MKAEKTDFMPEKLADFASLTRQDLEFVRTFRMLAAPFSSLQQTESPLSRADEHHLKGVLSTLCSQSS